MFVAVLLRWSCSKATDVFGEACSEPLWGNPLIRSEQNISFYIPSVAKCCYSTVGDVYNKPLPHLRTKAACFYEQVVKAIPGHWHHLPVQTSLTPSGCPHWADQIYLCSQSEHCLSLRDADTRTIYRRIVTNYTDIPISQKSWEDNFRALTIGEWEDLWKSPQVCSLQSTVEKDILWRLLHRTLPTQVNLCRWSLASSSNCPACHVQQDTSDHVFGSCAIWKDVLQNDLSLLRRSNVVTTQNEQSHVFDLLLETGYLQHFFAILLTTFWLQ